MLLHLRALAHLRGRLSEPVVLDHFETFEFSQDCPLGVATAVGARSWFVYGLDPAPHARAGRLSPQQRRRLAGRPRRQLRGGYQSSTRRTLASLLSLPPRGKRLHLVSDGHPAYVREAAEQPRVLLRSFPNPPRGPKGSPRTPAARARDRAMFPVDLLHALLRHSLAHHRRETIAFGRRLNALLERLFLASVWRNFVKRRSERRPAPVSPAMQVGLVRDLWTWQRVFSRRLFPHRQSLSAVQRILYDRAWTTTVLPRNLRHDRVHAY
jgi:hypothetical protein